jgi:mycothiol synthase
VPGPQTTLPDEPTRAAVLRLASLVEREDGAPPLSDQALAALRSPAVEHVVARDGGELVGYAQRHGNAAEVVATRAALPSLLDAVSAPGVLLWSHGEHSRLLDALRERGFKPVRELYQLRRPLTGLPPDPSLADGIRVRAFEPGRDDAAWLAVNAASFATHPEQGKWTQDDLDARMAEPWFDPAGFLLAERDRELLGFHWTKVHPDRLGEVYVLGIAPSAQGLGLGKGLLIRGLRHLAAVGCPAALLYVDGDNPAALRLYERAGFRRYNLDVQWLLAQPLRGGA